mmetsp:Transcript_43907/g.127839  ORF Transcript_43907/g.127839 Transcript_43907/m.127839 type:complete len:224 (-) Transcript_43907:25-696(-)
MSSRAACPMLPSSKGRCAPTRFNDLETSLKVASTSRPLRWLHVCISTLPASSGSADATSNWSTCTTRINSGTPSCRPHCSNCVFPCSISQKRSLTDLAVSESHAEISTSNLESHSQRSAMLRNEPATFLSFMVLPSRRYRWMSVHGNHVQACTYLRRRCPSLFGARNSSELKSTLGSPEHTISMVYKWYMVISPGKLLDISTSIVWSTKCSSSTVTPQPPSPY